MLLVQIVELEPASYHLFLDDITYVTTDGSLD